MAIIEKEFQPVSGWSLSKVVEVAKKWGANLDDVAVEPCYIGNGVTGVMIVWYGKE